MIYCSGVSVDLAVYQVLKFTRDTAPRHQQKDVNGSTAGHFRYQICGKIGWCKNDHATTYDDATATLFFCEHFWSSSQDIYSRWEARVKWYFSSWNITDLCSDCISAAICQFSSWDRRSCLTISHARNAWRQSSFRFDTVKDLISDITCAPKLSLDSCI